MKSRSHIHVDRHDGPAILKSSSHNLVSRWSPKITQTRAVDSADKSRIAGNGSNGDDVALQLDPPRKQNIVTFKSKHAAQKEGNVRSPTGAQSPQTQVHD